MTNVEQKVFHIKLKTGEDMLARIDKEESTCIHIHDPIIIIIDPHYGLYAKTWLNLSITKKAVLYTKDYYFYNHANEDAVSHYNHYLNRQKQTEEQKESFIYDEDMDDSEDAETMLAAMLESRMNIKH